MLQINGSVSIIPEAVRTEPSTVRVGGEENSPESAVLMSFKTASGIIQVVLPVDDLENIIDGLQKSYEAAKVMPKSDIIVADDMTSVEQFAADLKKINESKKEQR